MYYDWNDILDIVKMVLVSMLVMVFVISPFFGLIALAENNQCKTLTSIDAAHEYQWTFWNGCLVQTPNGYWIDADDYRYLEGDVNTP